MPSLMTNRFAQRRTLFSVWSACLLVTFMCLSLVPTAGSVNRTVASPGFTIADPGQMAFGKTYGEWASDWWDWVLQFPPAGNPLLDDTGALCDLGDQGAVWFLVGNFGGTTVRECTAPAGKAFFFPVFNVISFAPEFGNTVEEIRADANGDIELDPDPIISCVIDGVPVDDVFAFRAQTPPGGFLLTSVTLFEAFGLPAGPRDPAISDGYWLMVEGLGPGEHEIQILATVPNPKKNRPPLFELDVTYILTVGPGT